MLLSFNIIYTKPIVIFGNAYKHNNGTINNLELLFKGKGHYLIFILWMIL